jgi:hypothetical protein
MLGPRIADEVVKARWQETSGLLSRLADAVRITDVELYKMEAAIGMLGLKILKALGGSRVTGCSNDCVVGVLELCEMVV